MRIRTSRVPKDLQKITKDAVKFFCENFLHPRTKDRLEEIKISFIKSKSDELAWCGPEDAEEQRPVYFSMDFNDKYTDMRLREYLLTIFHELTHMRQYATGQLRDLNNGSTNWRGKNYPADTNYWLMPWEVEAQGMEVSVYQLFVVKYPEYNLKRFKKRYNGRHRSGWTGEKARKPVKNQ